MQRAASLALFFALAGSAHADCELPFAPPEIRAAAQAFHQRIQPHRATQVQNTVRGHAPKVPPRPHATVDPASQAG
ncbi:hypothetical protein ACXU4B_17560 [Dyella soli]|uniref:Uncharacterized protein n=1 Tax=Dyella soli TaxID=522319 RepID=A0A4R0YP02_9GAMM|nr:hypothetical protein [Dyella soli]TCI06395.1 hypothetical protein EZM97_33455 [Dyella soli]